VPAVSAPTAQLPRGGTQVFPAYRLVGFVGHPGSPGLGRLGVGALGDRLAELETLAAQYAGGRTPLPVLELIATVVHSGPGADGAFRTRTPDEVIQTYLDAARADHAYLLLDIQPGLAPFIDEVRSYERWLREPDVGIALDPEWAISPGQVPGRVFGHTTGADLDGVAAYLADVVAAAHLPEKVMVYHQLATSIVSRPEDVHVHPGVAVVVTVDGIGTPAAKTDTWLRVNAVTPATTHRGFKLFFDEDAAKGPLMTPGQVLALTPTPVYVVYE
jgi:hypothetical protein